MSPRPSDGSDPTQRRGGWRLRGAVTVTAVVLALATGVATLTTAPAAATVEDEEALPGTARLVVNGLQAVVGPPVEDTIPASEQNMRLPSTLTARLLVVNVTDEPLEGLDLVVQVYQRASSRSELRAALDGAGPAAVSGLGRVVLEQALDTVPPRGVTQVDLSIDAAEAGLVNAEDVSVHPVVISLAQQFRALDEVRTAAVGVPRPIARPLETSILLPLDGPVPTGAQARAAAAPELLPGGRLDRVLRALETAPPQVATAVPAAHALEDLQALVDASAPGASDMVQRLRTVVTERVSGVVSTPYALADVPALASNADTQDLAAAAIVAGRQRLLGLVGVAPDGAHRLVATQTPAAIDLAPTDVLVASWDDAAGPDLEVNPSADVPPALRRSQSPSGRALDVLVADPWATRQLATADGRHGWAVDAHRVVVESAMTFAQAPSREGRAFVALPPVGWDAPGRLPDELLARFATAPWLRLADPVTVAARATAAGAWEPLAEVAPERTLLLGRLGALQERLDGLAAAVVETESQPAVVEREGDLLRAVSTWPDDTPLLRAASVLDGLDDDLDAAIGEVVVPRDSVVTFASERGVIPVTVQHPTGVPMDVVVEVAAQGRLTFDEGTRRNVRLEEGGTSTVSFEARALGRGTFPIQVTVRTPTGDVVLARSLLSVRASAVSRPALLTVGGVVLLLLVLGRLRRPSRPRLEVVR